MAQDKFVPHIAPFKDVFFSWVYVWSPEMDEAGYVDFILLTDEEKNFEINGITDDGGRIERTEDGTYLIYHSVEV